MVATSTQQVKDAIDDVEKQVVYGSDYGIQIDADVDLDIEDFAGKTLFLELRGNVEGGRELIIRQSGSIIHQSTFEGLGVGQVMIVDGAIA